MISIRGGGHQVAGSAVCDEGLVIDLSAMNGVHVDPTARTVLAQGGVTWGELDRETQLFGLVTPGGEVSVTGVAGLTLGGGLGATMRTFGLSCDNLRSIEIVTADAMVRTASRDEHADLFWAARGGGRGLGVVTSLEFARHFSRTPGHQRSGHLSLRGGQERATGLARGRARRAGHSHAGDRLVEHPAAPRHPRRAARIEGGRRRRAVCRLTQRRRPGSCALQQLGTPLADLTGSMSYVEAQSGLDPLFPHGGRYYWKSHFINELTDEVISALLDCDAHRPNPESVIFIRTLAGAIARVDAEDSAYAHRSASFNLSVDASWSDPAMDEAATGWARSGWDAIQPFATGGIYINFAGLVDESDDIRHLVLGAHKERLDRIRQAYDPDGLFDAAANRP